MCLHNIRLASFLGFAALCFFLSNSLFAASPKLTYLYPAGVQKGQTVEMTAGGIDAWPPRVWVDDKRIDIKPAKERGKLTLTVAHDMQAGTHWMRLFNEDGASGLRPFIVGSLPEINELEPNDDPKKPHVLNEANVVVNGQLGVAGDVDHFSVMLKKGQILVASMVANEVLASPMDAHLQIVTPEGFVLAENHDTHGLDPQIVYSVPKDGSYIIRTFAFPSQPDASIRFSGGPTYVYRLTIATSGFADYAFPMAISLKEPETVALMGWNIPESAKRIAVKPDRVVERRRIEHPGVANSVALRVEPHRCIAEAEPNERSRPQSIEVPVTISGRIDPAGDIDVYEWTGKKGQRLNFQVEARSLGSALDPLLRLTDAQGKLIAEVDDTGTNADPEYGFTVPVYGRYRVEIRDLYRHGGPRHFYRLRIFTPEPDFSLTIAAEPTPAIESVEIPVSIDRLNGFAGAIEFKIEGLPEGLTAKIEPQKVTDLAVKTAKVKITASKGGFSGPIRILGLGSNLANPTRGANLPIPGLKEMSDQVWITIKPKTEKK